MNFASSRLFARFAAFFLAVLIFVEPGTAAYARPMMPAPGNNIDAEKPTYDFTLTPSKPELDSADRPPAMASGQPLSDDSLKEMLKRLPALIPATAGAVVLPEHSLVKPPLPGIQTVEPFPPVADTVVRPALEKVQSEQAALKIDRLSPSGQVENASEIAICFSQPMVPLQAAGVVDASKYLRLDPQPAGEWHWSGTQTLLFDPAGKDKRLPKATDYHITIPRTTLAVSGKGLESIYDQTIVTPPLVVQQSWPPNYSPQTEQPLIFLSFNQRVKRPEVFAHLQLKKQDQKFDLELVPDSEFVAFGGNTAYPISVANDESFIAVRPKQPLPLDATYQVVVMPGCPSAEGPKLTTEPQSCPFTVHGPLKCNQGPFENMAGGYTTASFVFNNELKTSSDDLARFVHISPALKRLQISGSGNVVSVTGDFKPFEKYTATISGDLKDVYDQKLGKTLTAIWNVGPKQLALRQDLRFVTIAPDQKPKLSFYAQGTKNIHLKIYRVKSSDWETFNSANYTAYDWQKDLDMGDIAIGDLIKQDDRAIGVDGQEEDIDLKPYLHGGHGQFIVVGSCPSGNKNEMRRFGTWVQVTELGVNAFKGKQFCALVTGLADGRPVLGASVKFLPGGMPVVSGKNGIAALNYGRGADSDWHCLAVSSGSDSIVVPSQYTNWNEPAIPTSVVWHCQSDRSLYKPGQTVNVKGWQRALTWSKTGVVTIFDSRIRSVHFEATARNGEKLASGSCAVDSVGTFNYSFVIPEKVDLGTVGIRMSAAKADPIEFKNHPKDWEIVSRLQNADKAETSMGVEVQDYRRPEFEMKVSASSANLLVGEKTKLSARATYFGGGSLPDTKVKWSVRAIPFYFHPPKYSEFQFGNEGHQIGHPGSIVVKTIDTLSDSDGVSAADLCVSHADEPTSFNMLCQATFVDLNRQSWSDSTNVVVHPGKVFVGAKYQLDDKNENLSGQFIVTDDSGKAVPDRPVKVALLTRDDAGVEKSVTLFEAVSGADPVDFSFALPTGNRFIVRMTSSDENKRPALASHEVYISHPQDGTRLAANSAAALTITTDKAEYKAGQTATVTVKSPIYPSEGLLCISRKILRETIPIKFVSTITKVDIPISEDDYPNLQLQAFVNGKDSRHATASISVAVPPLKKKLALKVSPEKQDLAPGSKTHLDIELKNSDNEPVENGHVAIVVIDEALLALRDYRWGTPLYDYYQQNTDQPVCAYSRDSIYYPVRQAEDRLLPPVAHSGRMRGGQLAQMASVDRARDTNLFQVEPSVLDERHFSSGRAERHQKTSAAGQLAGAQPFLTRINFSELALWAPDVVTDKAGRARVNLTLPDSTTKYRIMAVAVKDLDKFGLTENSLSTKMALSIKPSLPRFLNFGDKCQLSFIVQNQTDKTLTADVVARTQNFEDVVASGKRVDVPAHARVEVRFPATAAAQGEMLVQSAVSAGELSDAAALPIPVMVPASFEAFAAYGQVDNGGALQKLDFPKDVYEQFGGLTVTTSSTALQSLVDAYHYMANYPYRCSEQLSARILSMLALHDPLRAFGILDDAADSSYKTIVNEDLKTLIQRQLPGGGFGLWSATDPDVYPYESIQVIKALFFASSKDFKVDEQTLAISKTYLKEIRNHIPNDVGPAYRNAVIARALSVRHGLGDDDFAEAKQIVSESIDLFELKGANPSSTAVEMACWLLPTLAKADGATTQIEMLRRIINNSVVETASTASTQFKHSDEWFYRLYYSPHKVDGEILDTLIEVQPDSELIVKLVKGLLAHRKKGAWDGTQENFVILAALDKYFHRYEKDEPDFIVREWLGETFIGQQAFKGRTTESKSLTVPTKYIIDHPASDVLVAKEGPGRLYYRLGLDYVPRNLNLKALAVGFNVTKSYEGVSDKNDVTQGPDGTWHFKAGATVKCNVHFGNIGNRYHVALMAPMPAGCEPVNGALAGNETIMPAEPAPPHIMRRGRMLNVEQRDFAPNRWWRHSWYEHQNLRDHQAEAFASLLYAGEHDYSYTIRATTPGKFVVPPTKIEEMYDSETFGRTGTETVIVQ